jgi:hypothetical protein
LAPAHGDASGSHRGNRAEGEQEPQKTGSAAVFAHRLRSASAGVGRSGRLGDSLGAAGENFAE